MIEVFVCGISVAAPGVESWAQARELLSGVRRFETAAMVFPPPLTLSGAERRRSPDSVRLALHVAEQAREMSGLDGAAMASVFGSTTGDGAVMVRGLEMLTGQDCRVSPTDFHNSVHNAAVGYWAIGAGSHQTATSISAGENTFAAALLKASLQAQSGGSPVLLCVYDVPYPEPMHAKRPVSGPFAAAFVLRSQRGARAMARLSLDIAEPAGAPPAAVQPFWRDLFEGNAAARSIALLERLAGIGGAEPVLAGAIGNRALRVSATV